MRMAPAANTTIAAMPSSLSPVMLATRGRTALMAVARISVALAMARSGVVDPRPAQAELDERQDHNDDE